VSTPDYLAAALNYAARGWHVFPLCPVKTDGSGCVCGETRPHAIGKHPQRGTMWRSESTVEIADIVRMWSTVDAASPDQALPVPGIGIDCGRSGLVVVDLDIPDGPASAAALGLFDTCRYIATTPSGGMHLYFAAVATDVSIDNSGKVGPGIDIRGRGGFVVAPPTVVPRGGYVASLKAFDGALTPCPQEVVERLIRAEELPQEVHDRIARPVPGGYVGAALAALAHDYEYAPAGQGENAGIAALCRVFELANAPWTELDAEAGLQVLDDARVSRLESRRSSGGGQTEREFKRMVRSAYSRVGTRAAPYPEQRRGVKVGGREVGGPVTPTGSVAKTAGTPTAEEPAGPDDSEPSTEGSSWSGVDLGPYLDGTVVRPEPALGPYREDGVPLLYPGLEHTIVGEMEGGKSWLACLAARDTLIRGGVVVYIHFEEADPAGTVERILALGCGAEHLRDRTRFRFVAPVGVGDMSELLALRPALVIGDGVNEAMSLFGREVREEGGVAAFRRELIKPFTAVGAAFLSLDHVVKDRESRGRYALGSVHKVNAINGAAYMVESIEPFGRGQRGASQIYVIKDRPGALRQHGYATDTPGKTRFAVLSVDDTRDFVNYLDAKIYAAKPDEDTPFRTVGREELENAIVDIVNGSETPIPNAATLYALLRGMGLAFRDKQARDARDDAVAKGRIQAVTGTRSSNGLTRLDVVEETS
jgi:hypothetical protein